MSENGGFEPQSWEDVVLKDVNPQFELVPEGTYVYRIVSAAPAKFDPASINLGLAIESEGDSRGRRLFVNLSPPSKFKLSPKVVKRIEITTGIDSTDGENVLIYLQRLAQEGGRFKAPLTHRTYKAKDTGEDVTVENVKLLNASPAE